MNINQLTNSATSGNLTNSGQSSTQATGAANPVSQAMLKAGARLQVQLDSTTAQLSSFGKLKSAVSDVQLAASALHAFTATTSAADVKTAAAKFIASFNAAITTARSAAAPRGPVSAESSSANRISRDLGRSVAPNTATMDALRKLGVKQLSDGTLALDTAKFDAANKADPAAVRTALAKTGQQVNQAATKELATGGDVNNLMASLSQRSTSLKTQQSSMLAMAQKLAAYQFNY
ncbi:MAG: flagellar filament capping protein FliD [Rhodoferax sp.]